MFGCFFIGKDMDYVIKILDPDYSAVSAIKTLIDRCLLSITSNKKLMMHRLLQEMGRNIARQESVKFPARRSRIWLSSDSYKILSKGNGSKSIEGLALDMKMMSEQTSFKILNLKDSHNLSEICNIFKIPHLETLILWSCYSLVKMYEFDIMSTSLPDIDDPNMKPKYISKLFSVSFDVPSCPKNKMLKGINVILKYAISGDDGAWFCKVSTTTGVDLMYNPIVFGKPEFGKVCIWLSYWPIGNTLEIGDTVNISIVVMSGLEVLECGVSLVYSDQEIVKSKMGWEEVLGGDLSGFQLSTGAYYLCGRDFFELMEVGRLIPDWFRILVGDTIDYTEVRGWRKTGRPKQVNPSTCYTSKITVRCIIDGPELEDVYKIGEMSKLPVGDKTVAFTSSLLEEGMKTGTRSEYIDEAMEEIYENPYESDHEMIGDFISPHDEILTDKFDLSPPEAEVKLGYISGKKEDKPGYESEKEDEVYQRLLIKRKKSACFVL
ncbi:hypothetical protein E3N88_09894 [Mikania micrantha]|uniref:Disease resistance protein Roq1-like winged-helix domain-containing protein n=1 Tax=Mikania micrantha TaxID=192012 RepID=A0A5N6PL79_9ASTR|nr:hypothetical protein E3N88_09894 [Mikania micrantha]